MRNKLLKANQKPIFINKNDNLDTLLEEYMSKLEQKIVSQTQQLKTITDNATSCLFMIDIHGRPTFMNPAAEKITGYSLDEIKDGVLHDIVHFRHADGSAFPKKTCPIILALRDMKQMKDQEDVFIRKDGAFFPISFSIAPLYHEGKPHGAVLEFQDITKRKDLETQKDEFIGIASHELKTPVTSIKAYTQILHNRFLKSNDAKSAEMVQKMNAQLDKLANLIADLLDITKIEGGKLQFYEINFDFNEVVSEIIEEMQRTTSTHTIVKLLSPTKKFYGDRDRIGQVITNLISNAIKYSPHSPEIIIKTHFEKDNLTLSVQDFGIGMSKQDREKVFERFYRVGGAGQETYPGLGLGLYISSEIIKRHNGKIWVTGAKGKGSTFHFSLPFQK